MYVCSYFIFLFLSMKLLGVKRCVMCLVFPFLCSTPKSENTLTWRLSKKLLCVDQLVPGHCMILDLGSVGFV